MRVLGVDVGDRRVGIAVSDPLGMLANPIAVVERLGTPADYKAIADMAQAHEAERIVVGMPFSLNGAIGPQARKVLTFIEALRPLTPYPVETWDERFTTAAANDLLRERGLSPQERRKRIDAAAAAVLLQDYLDTMRARSGS